MVEKSRLLNPPFDECRGKQLTRAGRAGQLRIAGSALAHRRAAAGQGGSRMIISRTPYRISFFGGGTDYPSWYQTHGGAVLAATIDKYCYLTCRYLPPFFEHRTRVVYSKIESCTNNSEIAHPSVREVLRHLEIGRGVEIHHDGDLPARSGMGSSSAFTVGLLHAAYAMQGQMPSKHQLASEAIYVEQEVLKETVGSQDQVMAAFGGLRHVQFLPGGEFSVRPITLAAPRLTELNDHLDRKSVV